MGLSRRDADGTERLRRPSGDTGGYRLTEKEQDTRDRGLRRPLSFPPEFWSAVVARVSEDATLHASQVIGVAALATVQFAAVATSETTTSTTYADLATVGPELTGLLDGTYIVGVGGHLSDSAAQYTLMAPSVNAATPADTDAARNFSNPILSVSHWSSHALSSGSNTITAQYRVTGGTGTFVDRWLIALKIA